MNANKKKSIWISIFITAIVLVILIAYSTLFIFIPSLGIKLFAFIALLGISFAAIFVLLERIKEIEKGETDDLGKY